MPSPYQQAERQAIQDSAAIHFYDISMESNEGMTDLLESMAENYGENLETMAQKAGLEIDEYGEISAESAMDLAARKLEGMSQDQRLFWFAMDSKADDLANKKACQIRTRQAA